MIAPGSLPVLLPLVVGLVLKAIPGYNAPMGVGAFLMVGTIAAILMASFMNNGGGAWDNAKKFIEDGQLRDEKGEVIKKGSFAHQAAVVGDTVGDPLKDRRALVARRGQADRDCHACFVPALDIAGPV